MDAERLIEIYFGILTVKARRNKDGLKLHFFNGKNKIHTYDNNKDSNRDKYQLPGVDTPYSVVQNSDSNIVRFAFMYGKNKLSEILLDNISCELFVSRKFSNLFKSNFDIFDSDGTDECCQCPSNTGNNTDTTTGNTGNNTCNNTGNTGNTTGNTGNTGTTTENTGNTTENTGNNTGNTTETTTGNTGNTQTINDVVNQVNKQITTVTKSVKNMNKMFNKPNKKPPNTNSTNSSSTTTNTNSTSTTTTTNSTPNTTSTNSSTMTNSSSTTPNTNSTPNTNATTATNAEIEQANLFQFGEGQIKGQVQPVIKPPSETGLTLWLDASNTSSLTLSGNDLTSWKDISPTNAQCSVYTGTPQYSRTAFNSKYPGVILNVSSFVYNIAPGTYTQGMSIFAAFTSVGNQVYNSLVSRTDQNMNNIPSPFDFYNGTRVFGDNGLTNNSFYSTVSPFTLATNLGPTVASFVLNPAAKLYTESVNGVEVFTNSSFASKYFDNGNQVFVGSRGDKLSSMNGVIGEILIYNTALTQEQQTDVYTYLYNKWVNSS